MSRAVMQKKPMPPRAARWACNVASGAGMSGAIGLQQPRLVDRCINLRGGQAGVTEQFLDRTQIAAASQQMAGEGMAQSMRRGRIGQPQGGTKPFDGQLNDAWRQRAAPRADEQGAVAPQRERAKFKIGFDRAAQRE